MANLITEKQKNIVRQEYVVRLSAVGLSIVSLLGLFVLAYLLPYHFSLVRNDKIISEQLKSVINVENKENVGENVNKIALRLNEEMRAIELYSAEPIFSSNYFSKIIQNKNESIQISRLSFKKLEPKVGQFSVSGVAKTRQALVTFISDLKNQAGFDTVESPVSDFAKETNISFTIILKVKV